MENHALAGIGAPAAEKATKQCSWARRIKESFADMSGLRGRRVQLMRKAVAAFAAFLATFLAAAVHSLAHAGVIVPIDTLPKAGDPTSGIGVSASYQWHDLAVGFVAPTAGRIKHISTSLFAQPSFGPFYLGVATDALIGNPSAPDYFSPSAGSLAEFAVCADVSHPAAPWVNACDNGWGPVDFRLKENEALSFAADIFLPTGGTYWIYTRFFADEVFANWVTNMSVTTPLVATRTGIDPFDPSHTMFQLANGPVHAPGLRIEFEPGMQVSEPHTMGLLLLGLAGLVSRRRRDA